MGERILQLQWTPYFDFSLRQQLQPVTSRFEMRGETIVKKGILVVTLVIVGSFTGGLAISKYRQSAAIHH